MPNYLSPGVYVEEVEAGSRPIEGVGTAVAAFVGFAEKGPFNQPTLVTNWTQFTQSFGDFVEGSYLAHAVYGYFINGGGAAYIVRDRRGTSDGTAAPGCRSWRRREAERPARHSRVAALDAGRRPATTLERRGRRRRARSSGRRRSSSIVKSGKARSRASTSLDDRSRQAERRHGRQRRSRS